MARTATRTATVRLLLFMTRLVAIDDAGRRDRQQAIDDGENPERDPVAPHVENARAHLVDANERVDGGGAGEGAAARADEIRDGLDRPGHADHEEERQADRDKQQNRRLAAPEPRADELREETDGKNEGN